MFATVYDTLRRCTGPKTRAWFKAQPWFVPITKLLFGNDVYSESYFESIERIEAHSVNVFAEWIDVHIAPKRVIDVGCGPGHMMAAIKNRGMNVFGIDVATAALRRTRAKGLNCEKIDLTTGTPIPGTPYDLAICCEVAEHLDATHAPHLVAALCSSAPTVFMTAAEPDPSLVIGMHHVNEQPNEYWIALMAQREYSLDTRATHDARECFRQSNVISYLQKVMIFRRSLK